MDREDECKRITVDVSKLIRRHQNRGRLFSPGRAHRKPADWVGGVRHRGGVISIQALRRNCGNSSRDAKGACQATQSKALSTDARLEDGPVRMSVDAAVMAAEQRGWVVPVDPMANSLGRMNP